MFLNISIKSRGKWIVIVFITTIIILSISIFLMLKVTNKIKKRRGFNKKTRLKLYKLLCAI